MWSPQIWSKQKVDETCHYHLRYICSWRQARSGCSSTAVQFSNPRCWLQDRRLFPPQGWHSRRMSSLKTGVCLALRSSHLLYHYDDYAVGWQGAGPTRYFQINHRLLSSFSSCLVDNHTLVSYNLHTVHFQFLLPKVSSLFTGGLFWGTLVIMTRPNLEDGDPGVLMETMYTYCPSNNWWKYIFAKQENLCRKLLRNKNSMQWTRTNPTHI